MQARQTVAQSTPPRSHKALFLTVTYLRSVWQEQREFKIIPKLYAKNHHDSHTGTNTHLKKEIVSDHITTEVINILCTSYCVGHLTIKTKAA